MPLTIGQWVKRPGGKWHLVESIINDGAVTSCGRELAMVRAHGRLELSDVMPLTRMIGQPQLCHGGCYSEGRP